MHTTVERRGWCRSGWRRAAFSAGTFLALATALEAATSVRFDQLSLEEGLSQSSVYAIVQDRRGFLWLGTEDGLNRYDGYGFEIFRSRPGDIGSLASNTVYSLLVDTSGTLWVGTWGGLHRYSEAENRFTRFVNIPLDPSSLSEDRVWTMLEDRAGNLWVGTWSGGLSVLEAETRNRGATSFRRFRHDPDDVGSLASDRVRALYEDREGVLWVGTDGGGLQRYSSETETFTGYLHDQDDATSLSHDGVRAILEDGSGRLWAGTGGGGLNILDRDSGSFEHFRHDPTDRRSLGSDEITALHQDSEGRIWIGTGVLRVGTRGGGLDLYGPENRGFEHFRAEDGGPNSLSYNDILSIFEDREGTLWVGTSGGGVNRRQMNSEAVLLYRNQPSVPSSLSDNMVYALDVTDDGSLWVGTWEGGLNRMVPGSHEFEHFRHRPGDVTSLSDDTVSSLHVSRSGIVWIGTNASGLNRHVPGSASFDRYQHDPADVRTIGGDTVFSIAEEESGALWLAIYGRGVDRFDPETGYFDHYRHDPAEANSLVSDDVYVVYVDRSGGVWLGTEGAGVDYIDPSNGRVSHYPHDPDDPESLSSGDVLTIHQDQVGGIWVGTYGGGLNRIEVADGRVRHYRVEDGLPNDTIYGVVEDDDGLLWLSTNNGIARFDPETQTVRAYDVRDGLQSNEFNAGAYGRTPDGRLFFGGINGFNVIEPFNLRVNQLAPPVELTSVRKLNQELSTQVVATGPLEIDHDEDVLAFEFAALSFVAPSKNRYAYRLEGGTTEWIDLGAKRDITFTSLNPGSYTLQVKASNNDGVWNEEGLSIGLTVRPPFWRTWWARFGAAAGLMLGLGGAYRLRTRSILARNRDLSQVNRKLELSERQRAKFIEELEAKNAELERFTYTVSHDLKSPLVTIKGFVGMIGRDLEKGRLERVPRDLERIDNATDRMARLLEELLELSRIGRVVNRPERIDLRSLLSKILEGLAPSIHERGITVVVADGVPTIHGDRSRMTEVFQNLIDNAIRFMGDQTSPRIEVGGDIDGDDVLCYVRDNGIGVEEAYLESVFDLFERLDATEDGTGIGLAIVKRVVEVHGGKVWLESAGPGQGSTVWLRMPKLARRVAFEVESRQGPTGRKGVGGDLAACATEEPVEATRPRPFGPARQKERLTSKSRPGPDPPGV